MKVEVLYVADCPNHQPTVDMVHEVLREQGLLPEIVQIEVNGTAQAAALSFLGSPTVRVDGNDVEPNGGAFHVYGLSCRRYLVDGRFQGVPSRDQIRAAVAASWSKP